MAKVITHEELRLALSSTTPPLVCKRGFVVSTTSRNAMGADLLVTDDRCARACSIQVKTNAKPASFWLVVEKAKKLKSPSHMYVLVNVRMDGEHEYFVVPSSDVVKLTKEERRPRSTWFAVYKKHIEAFRNRWDLLGLGRGNPE